MLSMMEMIILVVGVLFAAVVCNVLLYWLQKRRKKNMIFYYSDFTENSTYGKMLNSDVSVDEIIPEFKLLD